MNAGDTWRTNDKPRPRGRVTFQPDIDEGLPFGIYVDGTARVHRDSLAAAADWLWNKCRLTLDVTSRPT